MSKEIEVRKIENKRTDRWLLEKHYAHRKCSRSFCYGLFVDGLLEGVVTYGQPASPWLCKGVCGEEHRGKVLELNRLCINSTAPKNSASMLIGRSLKMIPRKGVVVSYADTGEGHVGYVYQATNWLFTGTTKKRTDIDPGEGKHSRHYTVEDMKNRKTRSAKHRYVFFTDKSLKKHLAYEIKPYPKGESKRYDCVDIKPVEMPLFAGLR